MLNRRSLMGFLAAGALTLAACGSDDGGADSEAAAGSSTATVAVAEIEGIGQLLVDSTGQALYTADEEADGRVRCTDACTAFWIPLEPGAVTPSAAIPDVTLGVTERPDGSQQVTADGRPLYTFVQDSPGNVTGDGFEDDFGDQHLTWHAVRTDPAVSGGSGAGPATGELPTYDE